jgi:YhcH/YjgK/YiaL family protein
MAMLGKLEDLAERVIPHSRLGRGLALLQDCLAGRFPGIAGLVDNLRAGETRRVTVEGEALYMLIQCYQSKRRSEGRFEAHARHTDLQYVWSGRERIEVCDLHAVQSKPAYDANGNVFFPVGEAVHSHLLVRAGEVAVLLPEDAHAPCLQANDGEGELVRKIVVKIQDAHLLDNVSPAMGVAENDAPNSARSGRTLVATTPNQNLETGAD